MHQEHQEKSMVVVSDASTSENAMMVSKKDPS